MKFKTVLFLIFFIAIPASAEKVSAIRLGILPFGTVNWEITALKNEGLLDSKVAKLEIQHVANPQAGKIALQSGAVDIIVSDWIWVSRQRSTGDDFTFFPYSGTAGALVVPSDSPIKKPDDLKNIRLGIAGGELDKNWLLLKALAKKQYGFDIEQNVEKVYAAPPLLNQQIKQGNLDALINYWHYAARLESEGYRQLINGEQIQTELGISPVPSLGYVFKDSWANGNKQAIEAFLNATQQAKTLLCESDQAWKKIIPLTKAESTETQRILRQRYCEGKITDWGESQIQSAEKIFLLLKEYSNSRLTGSSEQLDSGTFYLRK